MTKEKIEQMCLYWDISEELCNGFPTTKNGGSIVMTYPNGMTKSFLPFTQASCLDGWYSVDVYVTIATVYHNGDTETETVSDDMARRLINDGLETKGAKWKLCER